MRIDPESKLTAVEQITDAVLAYDNLYMRSPDFILVSPDVRNLIRNDTRVWRSCVDVENTKFGLVLRLRGIEVGEVTGEDRFELVNTTPNIPL